MATINTKKWHSNRYFHFTRLGYLSIDTSQEFTDKQIASRTDTIRRRKNALVSYTRNEPAENPLLCPRRGKGLGVAQMIFQECVPASAIKNDDGWYRCCDCLYAADTHTKLCRVRPKPSADQEMAAEGNVPVTEQSMSQSMTPALSSANMDEEAGAYGHPTPSASQQSANSSQSIEVEEVENDNKPLVKAEGEAEQGRDVTADSQESSFGGQSQAE